jgi:hypothetical protein
VGTVAAYLQHRVSIELIPSPDVAQRQMVERNQSSARRARNPTLKLRVLRQIAAKGYR